MSVLAGAAALFVGVWLVTCITSLLTLRRPEQTIASHVGDVTVFVIWFGLCPWIGFAAFAGLFAGIAKLVSLVR